MNEDFGLLFAIIRSSPNHLLVPFFPRSSQWYQKSV